MVNKKVYHKILGTGVVTQINDAADVITVVFDDKLHKFPYPDAFEKFLTAADADKQKMLLTEIENKKIRPTNLPERPISQSTPKNKPPTHKNIIFKFNYCDGGSLENNIGFYGVCSEENINYNIKTAKRRWCSHEDCACAQYLNGEYSYKKLKDIMLGSGSVCNESRLLRDWEADMGWDLTNEVKPRKLPDYVRKNSLCVLTTREPDTSESERIVFAVYLVNDHLKGNEEAAGEITAHSKFRISLTLDEARKVRLWNYYANRNNPLIPKWGSGLTRTLDDGNAAALLADIAKLKCGTKDEILAKELFEYFCDMNRIDAKQPPEACGALQLFQK